MEGLKTALNRINWVQFLEGEIGKAGVLIGVSFILVLSVLYLLGALYRSKDENLKTPVTLIQDAQDEMAIFAKDHLTKSVHEERYAQILFRDPDSKDLVFKSRPLKIRVYERDTPYIKPDQICIENSTFDQIKSRMPPDFIAAEGGYERIKKSLLVSIKYPSIFNIAYLLNHHPDVSVRATAWIFVLTSIFSVAQTLILRALGY